MRHRGRGTVIPWGSGTPRVSASDPIEQKSRSTVSREPLDPRLSGHPSVTAARSWTRRRVRSLVLLDSWAPATHRMSSPQAARGHLRAEWTRSGDLSEPQAAALVALDETTPWQV